MPKDNNSNNIDNSGNLITFFFINPLIDNSGSNLNLNITDNSMSVIPINNSNNNSNLDFPIVFEETLEIKSGSFLKDSCFLTIVK